MRCWHIKKTEKDKRRTRIGLPCDIKCRVRIGILQQGDESSGVSRYPKARRCIRNPIRLVKLWRASKEHRLTLEFVVFRRQFTRLCDLDFFYLFTYFDNKTRVASSPMLHNRTMYKHQEKAEHPRTFRFMFDAKRSTPIGRNKVAQRTHTTYNNWSTSHC